MCCVSSAMKSSASKTWTLRATPGLPPKRSGLAGYGEASAGFLLGEVDHGALVSDADHALETERATEHVVREPLATGAVVGVQPERVV